MSVFSRFLVAHACNTLSVGIQIILVAWLAVGILQLPPANVGWVQSAVLLPNIIVLFFAGVLVDRLNAVMVLRLVNGALAIVHLGFWYLIVVGQLNLAVLLVYAVFLGTLNALIQNARETLLGRFSEDESLQKNVSRVTFVQFAAQAIGVALGVFVHWFDVSSVVLVQAFLCAIAMLFYWQGGLFNMGKKPLKAHRSVSLVAAFKTVYKIKALRTVLVLVAFNGLMHLGMFLVLLPIIATQKFGLSATSYVTLQLTFILGSIAISLRLMHGSTVLHPGQHVLFAVLYSGVIGLALSAGPTVLGLYALIGFWGVVAGASANLCRVVVQTLAPESLRAKTMSFYQTALFGMAPLGALLAGYLVHVGGTGLALKVMAGASFVVFFISMLQRELWAFRAVENTA